MHIIGNVVRKSIQTNLSFILNSLLLKTISYNPIHLSMPGIYSQLYNVLIVTIFLGVGRYRQECVCKCNRHKKRKHTCWAALDNHVDIFSAQLSWLCVQCNQLRNYLELYYVFQYNTTLQYQRWTKNNKSFYLRRDSGSHQIIWFY